MQLETVEITTIQAARAEGRRKFLEYREAVRAGQADDAATQAVDTLLMRSYRAIARGHAVLELGAVMRGAGLVAGQWYPKLAICRADASYCRVSLERDGGATFAPGRAGTQRYGPSRVWEAGKARTVVLPPGTLPTFEYRWDQARSVRERVPDPGLAAPRTWSPYAEALVPTIPPEFRPRFKLGGYCLLWEAVWTRTPPVDPILLKPLGGGLYAVLAQWDLSPLERAVLAGRV